MQVAITITDLRGEAFDIIGTAETGLSGSLLPGHTTNVIFGQLDSGSGTHLVSYPGAVASGLQGSYLTENTSAAGGVDGSVDLVVTQPVGFFAQGLQDLDAQGHPQSGSMLGEGNFSGLVNTADNVASGANIPTLIGAPFLLNYPAYIRNSQPIQPRGSTNGYSTPSITFYSSPTDPSLPVLAHKVFLQVRPVGQPVVAYFILLDENPYAPSTIISGQGASALFFTASAMTLHKGANVSSGPMVVDTGAQATLLSEIAAAELDLDLLNPDFTVQVQGLVTNLTAPGFYIDYATIPAGGGGLTWTNMPVVILNVESPEGGTLFGIFGSNLTANRDLLFNGAASTPYLGLTDPIVSPLMRITAVRRTGASTGEIDWHAEPAPPVMYLERSTNSLSGNPLNWTVVATNTDGTINGTFSVAPFVPGSYYRLQAPK